jgi:drug/metabolite transporter (DMT)-like permease
MTMLIMPLAFVLAVRYMPAHDVWSAYWLSPLTILGLGVAVLHERGGPVRWAAGFIGLLATALIERPDRGLLTFALLPALGVGAAISVHLLLSRVLRRDDPLASLFHTALWVFAALTLVVPFAWDTPSLRTLLGIVFIGLAGMACLYFLARAGETAPLPVVASFAYTELIWLLAFNVLIFHFRPDRWAALGSLIVMGLTLFMLVYEHRAALAGSRPDKPTASFELAG